MYDTFNSQSKSIGDLLGGNERARIVVPQFQRGYSWVKKHIHAFWMDITTFQKESTVKAGPDKYFLGPIVILPKSKELINLLDGQQRLATATVVFSVIRNLARNLKIQEATDFARDVQREMIEKPSSSGFALELGELDHPYFMDIVQSDPPKENKPKLRSHRNIQQAKVLLTDLLNQQIAPLDPTSALESLKKLYQAVRSDLVMACIPVQSERDAFRIFETLNDRGLRLSVPDLLLNYLMRVANNDEERKEIRRFWSEMLEQMERRDINRFLRHLWVSKYGDLKAQDLFTALKQHIESNKISSIDFTRTCFDECESYVQLLDHDEEHLPGAAMHVRALVQQLDVQPALPLLLSCHRLLPPADLETVVKWLLVFAMRYSIVSHLDPSGLETVLYGLARDVRSKMQTGPEQQGKTDPQQLTKTCLKHIKETLAKNTPSDQQIKVSVADLILSSDEAKYVVGKLASRMQTGTKEVKIDEANLEHIFPKNPEEKEWGGKANQEALEPLLWHIGNLTMLGERLNKKVGNKEFPIKKEHYAKASELEMAKRIARDYAAWDKTTIEDRAKKLAAYFPEVWNFDNPSRV
jgi:uncharacterized protein DUF262/uncharacterized protein DUF1524